MIEAVQAVVGSIVVVSILTCYALLHSMCDLKATQMNMKHSLIQEFIFYEFELDHNATEAIKNTCHAKDECAVDHSTVTRWFKKFYLSSKDLDDQAKSGKPKTMNF